ncbi:MAG: Wzz/FepE/Etk N-terminal domain-containing protein [Gammaproteobacteria bacterium]
MALVTAWIVCLGGWFGLSKIPNVYESEATVYVDTASLLRPLLRGLAVDVDISQKLGLMAQHLLSRPNLEEVIRKTDLDLSISTQEEFDALITKLQKNINLQQSHAQRPTRPRSPDLYKISARHQDPETARRIVQALLDTFIKDSIGDQRERSETAQKFLESQIEEYAAKLTEAEQRLRDFKRRNINLLPEQEASFYQRLQAARSALEGVELSLREANYRRESLQQQLEGTPSGQRAINPDGTLAQTPTEERLLALQQRLDGLLLRFTDEHPDVIETKRSIEQLKIQREKELEEIAQGAAGSSSAPNPLYQQLRASLSEVEAEIAALQVRRQEFQSRVENLKKQIETLTQVEAELQTLNRNYEIYRDQYNSLVSRRESARISEDVEQSGEDFKFKVINPPRTPVKPIAPPRLPIAAGILVAGLGGGAGLALMLSQFWPVVYGRRMLRDISGRPVFGGVSLVRSKGMVVKQALGNLFLFIGIFLIFPAFGLVAYLQITGQGLMDIVQRIGVM